MASSVSAVPRPPSRTNDAGGDDLYGRYCRFMEQARDTILRDQDPGRRRAELLEQCRKLPRERFEARMQTLAAEPAQLAQLRDLLRHA